jgi:alkylated DNA repair dioxygenase AlkB
MTEPDLLLIEAFLPTAEALYTLLAAGITWDERMQSRKTATFGHPYNYSGITYEAVPMHPLLVPVVDLLEVRLGFRPNNCLLNFYASGDSTMGFHSDSTEELVPGTGIAIVSLGSERHITFQYKRGQKEEFRYLLKSGSLLYMSPEIQKDWRHGIQKQPETGGRISLTFRQIA